MSAIRRYARQIRERFDPEKIILFGSHAYGKPRAHSDVDILVVMPCRNEIDQAFKIRLSLERPFPLDLVVRKPVNVKRDLADGDWFLIDIMENGKTLYEKAHSSVGSKGRGRLGSCRATLTRSSGV
jgi:predicted nucleotidyltransferase